jgi:predicted NBD/HSP70 family sugar kinase
VNLAALGEQWHGLGKGVDDYVYLHLGTGVGMGIVAGGELYRGHTGAAGEIGYLPLAGTDPVRPRSRRRGALDETAGASAIVERARRAGMSPPLTARSVFEAARRGEARASRVVASEAERIAVTVAAAAAMLDPELVILGGGIGSNGDLLLEPVIQRVRAMSPFRPRIEISALREDATLHGAVWQALQAAQDQLFDRGEVPA